MDSDTMISAAARRMTVTLWVFPTVRTPRLDADGIAQTHPGR